MKIKDTPQIRAAGAKHNSTRERTDAQAMIAIANLVTQSNTEPRVFFTLDKFKKRTVNPRSSKRGAALYQ
jgi:hypothetical protein